MSGNEGKQELYRRLPQLGELVESCLLIESVRAYRRELVVDAARAQVVEMREEIAAGTYTAASLDEEVRALPHAIAAQVANGLRPTLRSVINATGVILHTNLGRAPLSEAALARVVEVAKGYCNLELDLGSGERSRRDDHIEDILLRLVALLIGEPEREVASTRAALVVNNCAAATFLALNSLAEGGEVIVSRGELVEIGGGFRIPDILRKSGSLLREVGTTNRTRINDYAAAITSDTRLILRVHQSNFKIEGFTERPSLPDLIALSRQASVPVFEDQGTGCMVPLDTYGMTQEASLIESLRAGPDLVAASGDKLLGGPQCGMLIGGKDLIAKIRANPLLRAFRVDKMTYAALQATLLAYLTGDTESIPTLHMLAIAPERIRQRCEALAKALHSHTLATAHTLAIECVEVRSVVGGGTTPGASLPSFAVALRHGEFNATSLAAALRRLDPAVLARTQEDRVLLDLRTVPEEMDAVLVRLLQVEFDQRRDDRLERATQVPGGE
ncbi:MAG: L-seryl-tRNA(Sec) selenium transferase [Acidobacteriaceae bacterium]